MFVCLAGGILLIDIYYGGKPIAQLPSVLPSALTESIANVIVARSFPSMSSSRLSLAQPSFLPFILDRVGNGILAAAARFILPFPQSPPHTRLTSRPLSAF